MCPLLSVTGWMTFCVAWLTSTSRTCAGVAPGACSSTSAAAPATCGDAIDVPLLLPNESSLSNVADVIPEPGAKMSMQAP